MARKTYNPVAEICLYGTHAIGAGYIGRTADGRMFGDGNPVQGWSFTEAVWRAADEMRRAGIEDTGMVRIYAPGGERMADAPIGHIPTFGSLEWKPATGAGEITFEEFMAEAERQEIERGERSTRGQFRYFVEYRRIGADEPISPPVEYPTHAEATAVATAYNRANQDHTWNAVCAHVIASV